MSQKSILPWLSLELRSFCDEQGEFALRLSHLEVVKMDLAGTKASAVQVRAESKDYIGIDALITSGKVNLPLALSFFDDGDLRILSEEMKSRLATAAREVDPDHLPHIESFSHQIDHDRGYEL